MSSSLLFFLSNLFLFLFGGSKAGTRKRIKFEKKRRTEDEERTKRRKDATQNKNTR